MVNGGIDFSQTWQFLWFGYSYIYIKLHWLKDQQTRKTGKSWRIECFGVLLNPACLNESASYQTIQYSVFCCTKIEHQFNGMVASFIDNYKDFTYFDGAQMSCLISELKELISCILYLVWVIDTTWQEAIYDDMWLCGEVWTNQFHEITLILKEWSQTQRTKITWIDYIKHRYLPVMQSIQTPRLEFSYENSNK